MSPAEASVDEVQLKGGCALGCVAASMILALGSLALVALIALAVGVNQSVAAVAAVGHPIHLPWP